MMMSGGGGGGGGDGNGGERDHQQQEDEAFMKDFPKGYRFGPTDEELIKYYLNPKVNKHQVPPNTIKDVNIYAFNPWDLTEKYKSFYFFTPRERKHQNGKRPNRVANGGYWKSRSIDTPIIEEDTNKEIGYKRDLVFYLEKPPKADSKMNEIENITDWHMHEYTLQKLKEAEKKDKNKRPCTEAGSPNHKQLDEFVLCKLFLKPRKPTKDIAVDAAPPPSIAKRPKTTSSSAAAATAAALPENHHQMHQTAVVDHQYPLTSAAAAAAEEMVPENHHYMCQTAVAAAPAPADHQYSFTSMVLEAAEPEEMMPLNHNYYYSDNVNPSSSSALSSAILPSVNHHYYGEMNQQQLQPAILPSVNHHYYGEMMNQQQLQSAMLPSVNQHYYGEMNQQQLQMAELPSVNHHTYGQMNEQQLQSAILPSVNHQYYGEMNQQQLQPAVLPSVNHHTYGQMNQQQLQPAVPEKMMPMNQYQHHMHQTDAAAINQQCPLTSMVATAVPEEMMPLNDSYNGPDNINPSSVAASSAILPSVNHHHHGEMTQQQLQEDFEWEMLLADLTNTDSKPNSLGSAGFSSLPEVRTDIGPRRSPNPRADG